MSADASAGEIACKYCGNLFERFREVPDRSGNGGGLLEPVCHKCAAEHPRCRDCYEELLPPKADGDRCAACLEKIEKQCRALEAKARRSISTFYCRDCGAKNPNPKIEVPEMVMGVLSMRVYCRPCYAKAFPKPPPPAPGPDDPVSLDDCRRKIRGLVARCRRLPGDTSTSSGHALAEKGSPGA